MLRGNGTVRDRQHDIPERWKTYQPKFQRSLSLRFLSFAKNRQNAPRLQITLSREPIEPERRTRTFRETRRRGYIFVAERIPIHDFLEMLKSRISLYFPWLTLFLSFLRIFRKREGRSNIPQCTLLFFYFAPESVGRGSHRFSNNEVGVVACLLVGVVPDKAHDILPGRGDGWRRQPLDELRQRAQRQY